MIRFTIAALVILGFAVTPADAGSLGARFTVGIRVISRDKKKPRNVEARIGQYTLNAAHVALLREEFSLIQNVSASDDLYWFKANRRGASYRVAVSRSRGKIVKIAQR